MPSQHEILDKFTFNLDLSEAMIFVSSETVSTLAVYICLCWFPITIASPIATSFAYFQNYVSGLADESNYVLCFYQYWYQLYDMLFSSTQRFDDSLLNSAQWWLPTLILSEICNKVHFTFFCTLFLSNITKSLSAERHLLLDYQKLWASHHQLY